MNNPFDYVPDRACEEASHSLLERLDAWKKSLCPETVNFCRELEAGKMLGVLVAADKEGVRHTLFAFSGQLGSGGFHHDGFVGAVFDYLQPDGYFKTHEAEISRQNKEINLYEKEVLSDIRAAYTRFEALKNAKVTAYKEKCRLSKLGRETRRATGEADDNELAAMIRQSQFEKAELHRLKKRIAAELQPLKDQLNEAEGRLEAMKEKRHADSEALQQWLFSNFKLLNARGESRSIGDIFADTSLKIPPSGAGECCAPKLLQAAYLQGLTPISIAEYWYGSPKEGEVRLHGEHYPACRGKCLPVLSWMLQGLEVTPPLDNVAHSMALPEPEIIYENKWFCVVSKPSGMLSVPGKRGEPSVEEWLIGRYGPEKSVKVVHRLDQDTSGLLIAAFGPLVFKVMQRQFAMRQVKKTYVAELEGDYEAMGLTRQGSISLPLVPDYLDRPRQRVDFEQGKEAVTDYEFIGVNGGRSRIMFHPLTGRTHQLRVHAASVHGLGMPIVGDRLYGKKLSTNSSSRLLLHAHKIEFTFPIDRRPYSFELPVPF